MVEHSPEILTSEEKATTTNGIPVQIRTIFTNANPVQNGTIFTNANPV